MSYEFHRELPCELTDEEVADRADRMAQAIDLRQQRDAKRKEIAAAHKRELDALDAEVRLLADAVRLRREPREVLCRSERQRDGSVLVIRTDTGDIIEVVAAGPGVQVPLWHDEAADDDLAEEVLEPERQALPPYAYVDGEEDPAEAEGEESP